jgi:hypothetical protein
MNSYDEWIWMLAMIPLWGVMSLIWFWVIAYPRRISGPRMRQLLDGAAVSLSMSSALAVLVGLNCQDLIYLPMTDPACHSTLLQLRALGL